MSPVVKDELIDDYFRNLQNVRSPRGASPTAMGRFLHRVTPGLVSRQVIVRPKSKGDDGWTVHREVKSWVYVFPPLQACRESWEKLYGQNEWPQIDEQASIPEAKEYF